MKQLVEKAFVQKHLRTSERCVVLNLTISFTESANTVDIKCDKEAEGDNSSHIILQVCDMGPLFCYCCYLKT